MIPIGTEVEWRNPGREWEPVKRGVVIAHLPPGQRLSRVIPPGTPRSRIRGEDLSIHRRYVVAVRKPQGKVTYYYTPVAQQLERQFAERNESGAVPDHAR